MNIKQLRDALDARIHAGGTQRMRPHDDEFAHASWQALRGSVNIVDGPGRLIRAATLVGDYARQLDKQEPDVDLRTACEAVAATSTPHPGAAAILQLLDALDTGAMTGTTGDWQ